MADILARADVAFAVDVATRAALLARRIRAGFEVGRVTKQDLSPVTVADFALQALVAQALEQAYPADRLIGEESSTELRANPELLAEVTAFVAECVPGATGESVCRWIDRGAGDPPARFWVLDPIDGTKGYIRGGHYAVALSLVDGGTVEIGVLACPNLREDLEPEPLGAGVVAAAARGCGAWMRPLRGDGAWQPLRASDCAEAGHLRALRSYEDSHTNAEQIDRLMQALGNTAEPVRLDSQAKFVILAGGRGDLLLRMLSPKQPDYREKIWDIAAGAILIEEAGGAITDLDGRPLDYTAGRKLLHNRGIAASNGRVHQAVVAAIRQLGY